MSTGRLPNSPTSSFSLGYQRLDDPNDSYAHPNRQSRCREFCEIGAILAEGSLAIGGYAWGGASKAVKVVAAFMGGNALQLGINKVLPLNEQRFVIIEQFAAMNGLYYLLETLYQNFADKYSPAYSPSGATLALEINVTLAAMVLTSVASSYRNREAKEMDLMANSNVINASVQKLSLYCDSDQWQTILNTTWVALGILLCSTNHLIGGDEGKLLKYAGPFCISSTLGSIVGRKFKVIRSEMEKALIQSQMIPLNEVPPSSSLVRMRGFEASLDIISPIISGILFSIPDTSTMPVILNALGVGFLTGLNTSIKSHVFTNTSASELKDTRLNPLGSRSGFSEGSEVHKPIFAYHLFRNVLEAGGIAFLLQSVAKDPFISVGAKAATTSSVAAYCLLRIGQIFRTKDIRSIIPGIGPFVWVDVQVVKDPAASEVLKLTYTAFTGAWIFMRYFSDHINRTFKPGESSKAKNHAFFTLNLTPEKLSLLILVTEYLQILINNKTLNQVSLNELLIPLFAWIFFGLSLGNIPLNQYPRVVLVFTARWVSTYLRLKDPL